MYPLHLTKLFEYIDGTNIFKSGDPKKRARAIVMAVTHFNDPKILAEGIFFVFPFYY